VSLKGPSLRVALEQLGVAVIDDRPYTGSTVRTAAGVRIGSFDLCDDGAFRFGWVEAPGAARIDCLTWQEFHTEVQEAMRP
jgi:hypothetical protein